MNKENEENEKNYQDILRRDIENYKQETIKETMKKFYYELGKCLCNNTIINTEIRRHN